MPSTSASASTSAKGKTKGKTEAETKATTRHQKLKRGRSDPPPEDDDENIMIELQDDGDDEDEEEEEWTDDNGSDDDGSDDDDDSDSSYVPPKKSKYTKKSKRVVQEDTDESEDIEDDASEDDRSEEDDENGSDDDDETSRVDPRELRKTIAALFPSNYINSKVRADERDREREAKKKASHKSKSKSKSTVSRPKRLVRRNKRREEESDGSESDGSESSDGSDDDDEEDETKDFNIIFTMGGLGGLGEDEDEAAIRDDPDEECDSEDEKTFMKETYEKVELPGGAEDETASPATSPGKGKGKGKGKEEEEGKGKSKGKGKDGKGKGKGARSKKRNKSDTDKSDDNEAADTVEAQYQELVELKKHLTEKLAKKPNNKILIHAIEECRASIQKLVKKSRTKNAKKYYKMINGQDEQQSSEIEYFKKKLSNKEQLRAMKEMAEINDHIIIKKPYRLTLLDSQIPAKYKATVMQKLNMLKSMEPGDPEYYKLKTWVDTFMRIPFSIYKNLSVNISDGLDKCSDFMGQAKHILDECVYGLDDAKMQILQMVGQWITNPSALGTAVAIKGPPGTGKTSLVKEGISKILGREFAFIALGGTGDASFLEGHSYTYEGSMWGKIIQIMIDSKCMNPVIYFDELDKVSDTPRGEEIIGILTHLTDTTQNNQFHDKYFAEVDFDLSKCMFIFSYNDESKVNPILRDRMYRIQTKGYDAKEKLIIARQFLLPKIREQVGFQEADVIIPDETLQFILSDHGMTSGEAGVRNLKRCLEIIHTKLNLFRLMKPGQNLFSKHMDLQVEFPFTVTKRHVEVLIKNEDTLSQSMLAMYV